MLCLCDPRKDSDKPRRKQPMTAESPAGLSSHRSLDVLMQRSHQMNKNNQSDQPKSVRASPPFGQAEAGSALLWSMGKLMGQMARVMARLSELQQGFPSNHISVFWKQADTF